MDKLLKKVTGYSFTRFEDDPLQFFDVKGEDVVEFKSDFWKKELSRFSYYENLDEFGGLFTPPKAKPSLTGVSYDHSKRLAPFITSKIDIEKDKLGAPIAQDFVNGAMSGLYAYGFTAAGGLIKYGSGTLAAFTGQAAKSLLRCCGWVGVIVGVGVPLVSWILRGDADHLLTKALQSFIASTSGAKEDKFLRKLTVSRVDLTPFELSMILTLQQFGFAFVDKDDYFVPVIWNPDEMNHAETLDELRSACLFFVTSNERGKNAKYF